MQTDFPLQQFLFGSPYLFIPLSLAAFSFFVSQKVVFLSLGGDYPLLPSFGKFMYLFLRHEVCCEALASLRALQNLMRL
jgi:hypothetical protein